MYKSLEEMEKVGFKPYYAEEKNEGRFLQTPKQFYSCPFYLKYLNSTARELYAWLWDRKNLSSIEKNREEYTDEKGRVFAIFTRKEAMKTLNLSKQTCSDAFKVLNITGLIFERKRGQGNVNYIYVLHTMYYTEQEALMLIEETENLLSLEKTIKEEKKNQKSKNQTSEKTPKKEVQKSKNQTSKSKKNRLQEVEKLDGNNTDPNNTDPSKTESNPSILSTALPEGEVFKKWEEAKPMLENIIGAIKFKAYIEKLKPLKIENNILILEVPNNFTKELIDTRYSEIIIKTFKVLGYDISIGYEIPEE